MANYYFEIPDQSVPKHGNKYYVAWDRKVGLHLPYSVAAASDRIWCERDGIVCFLKHRWSDPDNTKVDLKEFVMIKLKAKSAHLY